VARGALHGDFTLTAQAQDFGQTSFFLYAGGDHQLKGRAPASAQHLKYRIPPANPFAHQM
jgi:hypothetical protein